MIKYKYVEYRQPVSIECPRSYEPRALPLRHVGEKPYHSIHCCRIEQ